MEHANRIQQLLDAKKKTFTDLNDEIWGYAEPRFAEYKSAAAHCRVMEAEGFRIKVGLAGEETAFVAEYGSGKPVIAILGEYDALAGLSQEADCTEPKPVEVGGQGHGCGHNTLGSAGAAAIVHRNIPLRCSYTVWPAASRPGSGTLPWYHTAYRAAG